MSKCYLFWHDEKIIDRAILPSAFEQMNDKGVKLQSMTGYELAEFFKKKFILTFQCQKCRRVRTVIHD